MQYDFKLVLLTSHMLFTDWHVTWVCLKQEKLSCVSDQIGNFCRSFCRGLKCATQLSWSVCGIDYLPNL
jgi:hypothetical protein